MKRAIPLLFKAAFLFTLVATVSVARTIHVSPTGDDSFAEPGNPARPFKSLTLAFGELQNGDRLEIHEGSYQISPGYPSSYYPMPDSAPMKLQNLTNVVVSGIGEVEIHGDGPGDFLLIENCSNIRVENIGFKGNRPSIPEGPDASLFSTILLRAYNDSLHFEKCRITSYGDHAISHLYGPKTSFNMVVTNCYFADGGDGEFVLLGEDGAAISGISSGSRIVNNTFNGCLRGIEIEGAFAEEISDVQIEGNVLTNCTGLGIMLFATYLPRESQTPHYSDIRIRNNRISNMHPDPAYNPFPRVTIGIYLLGGENLTVTGNIIEDAEYGGGIFLNSAQMGMRNVIISSNVVQDVRFRGIQLYQQSFVLENGIVVDNKVLRAGEEGIWLNGRNIQCKGNFIEDSGWLDVRGAITMDNFGLGSANARIADNTIRNNNSLYGEYGIWLRDGPTNSVLSGNTFTNIAISAIRDDGVNTSILPTLDLVAREKSTVKFRATGAPGRVYQLEFSPSFSRWVGVTNAICTPFGSFECDFVSDPSQLSPRAFFRLSEVNE